MTENKKFLLAKEPFIRKADNNQSTRVMMRDFIIALIPLILFAWIKNGLMPFIDERTNFLGLLYPLLLVIIGGGTSLLLEFLWYSFIVKEENVVKKLKYSFPVIPGLLLAMILPLATPIWALILGVFFATVVGKLIFGGFGSNVFNPALVGYLFITFAYAGILNREFSLISATGVWNGSEILNTVSGATPLTVFSGDRTGSVTALIEQYGLLNMFLGFNPGALAETSAVLCLVSMIYLIVRKTIKWTIPVLYIGTVFVLTYIVGAFNGYLGLNYALFGIFNGGLMFGAVFMATEPVTSPRNTNGRVIYAIGMGVLTVLFRFASKSAEGVATSILIMNMFTPIIERIAAKIRVEKNLRKVSLTYGVIALLFLGISTFAVASNISLTPVVELEKAYQDYSDFTEFEYVFDVDGEEVVVTTEQDYSIKSISNEKYDTEELREIYLGLINSNKFKSFIVELLEDEISLKLTIQTKGFQGNFKVVITYDNTNKIIAMNANTDNESYEHSGEWDQVTHPKDYIRDQILANPDDLSDISVVTGATVTSNAIIDSVRTANNYIASLSSNTDIKVTGSWQNYSDLGYTYIIRNGSKKLVVKTDKDNKITSTVDSAILESVKTLITEAKFVNYVESADAATKTFVIKTKGFGSNPLISTKVTYDANFKITGVEITHEETYEYSATWDGREPGNVLPNKIIENQNDLSKVEVITGATVTSRAIKRAAQIALDYLKVLEEAANE